uniref:Ycf34 n=1 Tax=Bostrychia simpliciuscula TaxID=324754 RepID=A0A1Z1M836_9FLOR|nr:hypothetical protein [Bostrychia simpliciuscula]ARW62053.1 hypothetical protein [Bostrychia simpliciuscula]
MCICINCRHIDYCKTYNFINKQHLNEKKNLKKIQLLFIPKNIVINININKKDMYTTIDWDLIECLSFIEKPGNWLLFYNK